MPNLKRILLVEDNRNDAELTLGALKEQNVTNEVVIMRNGADALDYLFRRGEFTGHNHATPVVVLLDLKMPKVDGLEVLAQLKQDPELKKIPVVMLTSSREERDLVKSYELGVNAYVVKPLDFQQFLSAVKQIGLFWGVTNEPPPNCGR
jgi:CheY-like chemotaxis protein